MLRSIWMIVAMPIPQKKLTVVPVPLVEAVANALPVLEGNNPTVEYKCGNCGAVLMRVDENEVRPLIVHCTSCDAFNSTDV
jgi:DNA-directed RNA polymerase subunit RPC12/RpoP